MRGSKDRVKSSEEPILLEEFHCFKKKQLAKEIYTNISTLITKIMTLEVKHEGKIDDLATFSLTLFSYSNSWKASVLVNLLIKSIPKLGKIPASPEKLYLSFLEL